MKQLRNYKGSAILTEAVSQEVVTETEADIVIDTKVYQRSALFLSREFGIPAAEVNESYATALRKLREWFLSGNLEAELLLLRYGWL